MLAVRTAFNPILRRNDKVNRANLPVVDRMLIGGMHWSETKRHACDDRAVSRAG
jgi:hypothetical protein